MQLRFLDVPDTCRDILFGTRNFSFLTHVLYPDGNIHPPLFPLLKEMAA
jgi:hypothetical protein